MLLNATRGLLVSRGALPLRAVGLVAMVALNATPSVSAQEVPIEHFSVDPTGRPLIRVASSPDYYYVLYVRHDTAGGDEEAVSMALGEQGTTTLTEALTAYPEDQYSVARVPRSSPGDIDRDGIDDLAEFLDQGRLGPFNPAAAIPIRNGTVSIPDRETFEVLSYEGTDVRIDQHLKNLEFVKFYLLEMNTDNPEVYFMNTQTHRAHNDFARAVGIRDGGRPGRGDSGGTLRGEIVYHPQVLAPSGAMGVYRFEFEPNDRYAFDVVQRAYELMAKNMPLLQNDWTYYPMPNAALPRYEREKDLYDESRVAVILDSDILGEVSFIPLNLAEGYGLLRVMDLDDRPSPRDVVLYEALPNELSRVAGIITTVPQTPLSHVNLRAIQDGVPNAYVKDALQNPLISNLVGKHVYYRVGARDYEVREATLAEVEAHYAMQRPTEPQVPVRDLRLSAIAPLADVRFEDWTSYGVKSANVATLGTFGFPEGTVPDGFAVPFYYYDEFMKHNGFYDDVRQLLDDPQFQSDYAVQEDKLDELRDDIEDGEMPQWMLDDLEDMHEAFPVQTSIRCRSSTNNEDLPGFSGAGLYDSYTHHPDEGHISKSIKQVYASLWNFRAFDEREFYRIDHFETAMGVLVHPSYEMEKANGVGVTTDPIYKTEDNYYLNTQVGENLVTNPEQLSIPEEILLGKTDGSGYTIVRRSNQVGDDAQVMSEHYLDQMRSYLVVIDDRFRELYGVGAAKSFAMEIEYKITENDTLAIKQARPWHFDEIADYLRATPDEQVVPSASGSTTVNIFANVDWTVSASGGWFSIEPMSGSGDGTLVVSYDANSATEDRTATIAVSDGRLEKRVVVVQEGSSSGGPTPTSTQGSPSPTPTPSPSATELPAPVAVLYLPYLADQ